MQRIATKKDKEDKMCEENWDMKEQSILYKTWKLQGMDHIFKVKIQMKLPFFWNSEMKNNQPWKKKCGVGQTKK